MRYKSAGSQSGFSHFLLLLAVIAVVGAVGYAGWRVHNSSAGGQQGSKILVSHSSAEAKAVAAGKMLSNNKCQGTGKLMFTHLPMNQGDFGFLVPYGDVIGGHVTPIDHQYFTPASYNSARDSYPVYAMADANIVDIQPRTTPGHGTDYRLIFAHSCTSLYYYDLLTDLSGAAKVAYDKGGDINLPVKAGDRVGLIGGQTLDFALWDTSSHLTGFVNPSSYDGEAWKIYVADPFPSYTPDLRAIMVARDPRTAQPIAGKIDYDIDGKLIGNWFLAGSGGYHSPSNTAQDYWTGHLSIAPDVYDPSVFVISLGDFGGQALQFIATGNTPDPATVGVNTGLVKYDLNKYGYDKGDGSRWDNMTMTLNPEPVAISGDEGCLLAQLTATRSLKAESFPGTACSGISGFDSSAKTYTR
ncbi:MAG TPA: hypothetical protein VEH48_01870 [Candidatus Nitrosopolaris sp.]|nr:hypothetical protein [Candidatus Nitrosopolaris sp.]